MGTNTSCRQNKKAQGQSKHNGDCVEFTKFGNMLKIRGGLKSEN